MPGPVTVTFPRAGPAKPTYRILRAAALGRWLAEEGAAADASAPRGGQLPLVRVTGYGNGRRVDPTDGSARRTGQRRADAVRARLLAGVGDYLRQLARPCHRRLALPPGEAAGAPRPPRATRVQGRQAVTIIVAGGPRDQGAVYAGAGEGGRGQRPEREALALGAAGLLAVRPEFRDVRLPLSERALGQAVRDLRAVEAGLRAGAVPGAGGAGAGGAVVAGDGGGLPGWCVAVVGGFVRAVYPRCGWAGGGGADDAAVGLGGVAGVRAAAGGGCWGGRGLARGRGWGGRSRAGGSGRARWCW